ncbi:putative proteinase inhibitor I20 [Medicago truncatula]|uniref:Potato type II proteinase inhibitor family protein n=1 Tax=Medicago truncatula TaxID=3880 RepID=A0A072UHW5_MEDTR|nr:potato type II proteinase inhibitor family protein [Medicago truncatula]RHN59543.1 putative proteinase inhibitor I20 [Medicago truncatula]
MALKVETILLVLVCGAIFSGGNLKNVDAQKICPQFCYDTVAYMTCPSTGGQHLYPKCNCCLASIGCILYEADGTPICTAV